MLADWECPEQLGEEMAAHVLTVKKIAHMAPVTAEQLLDAGIPLPPGMEPPPAPKPLPRRLRWRMARAEFIDRMRRRIGFWIAGHEPYDEDW